MSENVFEQPKDIFSIYPEKEGAHIQEVLENLIKANPLVGFALQDSAEIITGGPEKPYHNLEHTLTVVTNIIYMHSNAREEEKLTDEELALVIIGACYHDTVLKNPSNLINNEAGSGGLAVSQLIPQGLPPADGNLIQWLILSTHTQITDRGIYRPIGSSWDRSDTNRQQLMSQYIQDADVASLGSNKFFINTTKLARELGYTLDLSNFRSFLKSQITILLNFQFNTTTAGECFPYQQNNHTRLKTYLEDPNQAVEYLEFCKYFNIPMPNQIQV